MDLYQTLKYHNRMWSEREIICFSVVVLVVGVVLLWAVYTSRIRKTQAVATMLLLFFLGIVFASTVFTREVTERSYELTLFWSWREAYMEHGGVALQEIVLNCILLMPMGVLLPWIAGHQVKARYALADGFVVSATIEICQLIFKRGLFEWDDMIHNAVGCMVGCCIMNLLFKMHLKMKK